MDGFRFDAFSRLFAGAVSRRWLLGWAGLFATAPVAASAAPDAGRKKCKRSQRKCGAKCLPKRKCCVNADCPAEGQTCQGNNVCGCPAGQRRCRAACLRNDKCCNNADCTRGFTGETCQNGECNCPPNQDDQGGACGTPPTCIVGGDSCSTANGGADCCSGPGTCFLITVPDFGACEKAVAGQQCRANSQCQPGLECIGFVCTS